MVEQRSRLQLLDELHRLDRAHGQAIVGAADSRPAELDALFERYSYAELAVIADFLSADTARLLGSA